MPDLRTTVRPHGPFRIIEAAVACPGDMTDVMSRL